MTFQRQTRQTTAMTMIELAIVIVVVTILAVIALSSGSHGHVSGPRIACVNNLKQIGLSFRVWALDNQDRFPMQVSITNGGTMELIGQDAVFMHYLVMSNELTMPRILYCPSDSQRDWAHNSWPSLSNSNLSYFVNVDAVETNITVVLAGDRNLTNGTRIVRGMLSLPPDRPVGWTADMHEQQGNVLLVDGSVQQITTLRLRDALQPIGKATNRHEMP